MQLAKIRRKTQPVKKLFYEIWKIAVDLGEFGARRQGRCGVRSGRGRRTAGARGGGGCEATRRAAGCKRGAGRHAGRQGGGARRRGEHCRAQARRGHGERDCGTGTACGTGRRGGRGRVQAQLGAPGRRDSERNAARCARAGRKPRIFAAPQRRTAQSSLFQPSGRHLG